jgi:chromosome partitioning protein
MKSITIINQKGGVGKSTTALSIGAGLVLKGCKVLYVDLDPQGNLTYTIGASSGGSLEILKSPDIIKDLIQHTGQGDIIASSPTLAGADSIITATGKEYRLKRALEHTNELYDYCIVDTPPTLSILTINALTACKEAIIPAQADIYSLQSITQLKETIDAIKEYTNPNLSILGILLTRFNSRLVIKREVAETLEQIASKQLGAKVFKTKIRECTALVEAQAKKKDIFSYAPGSNASTDYNLLLMEILKNEKNI